MLDENSKLSLWSCKVLFRTFSTCILKKSHSLGTSLVVQWLRLHPVNAGDTSSFPGQGPEIASCQEAWIKKKKSSLTV